MDPHRVLGLEPGASQADVKRAYRHLAKVLHPDTAGAGALPAFLARKPDVVVLERVDQPLAVDPPLMREIRAAMTKALENGRVANAARLPHEGITRIASTEVPEFYSGCFGLGSRDLQPGEIVAAVQNMLLAAHAEGLGTCWMTAGSLVEKEVLEFLGKTDQQLLAITPIGYSAKEPPVPPRKPREVRWLGFE